MHMKNSFPKRAKRLSKNRCCNDNAKFGDHVLEKISSKSTYICIYSYVKSSFLKHYNQTWHWYCSPFVRIALSAFWKKSSSYDIYIYIYIYSLIYVHVYVLHTLYNQLPSLHLLIMNAMLSELQEAHSLA